jgi:DNA-binding transcriptional ArsR family regulator
MVVATPAEPRFARVASAIGDPTRARMLSRLLDGRHYTAKELADCAGVTASTASGHLRLLVDERLASSRSQGRHRYFTLADGNVAHALEALLRVADAALPETTRWLAPNMSRLRYARTCYGHLAGELGVQLCDAFVKKGWAVPTGAGEQSYALTATGQAELEALNLPTLAAPSNASTRSLYGCVDWSERRDHFAGPQAVALLHAFVERDWLRKDANSRALQLTPAGRAGWLASFLGSTD